MLRVRVLASKPISTSSAFSTTPPFQSLPMSRRRVAALDLVEEGVEANVELAGRLGPAEVGDEGQDDVAVPLLLAARAVRAR